MDLQNYVERLGILHMGFNSVDRNIRHFFYRHYNKTDPLLFEYSTFRKGDPVERNPLTARHTFGRLVSLYNAVADPQLQIVPRIVTVRNAIAHGRVFKDHSQTDAYRLVNFNDHETD